MNKKIRYAWDNNCMFYAKSESKRNILGGHNEKNL